MSRAGAAARRGLPSAAGVAAPVDKRFKRADMRRDRPRRLARLCVRIGMWLVPALVLAAGLDWTAHAVVASPWLRVRQVIVHGNAHLSAADVDTLLEDARGRSILRLDLDGYRRRLLASPWVADAALRRELPSTLDVRIVERSPLATARVGQQLYLVDRGGVVVGEYTASEGQLDLPIVDGLVGAPATAGTIADPDRVRLVTALLGALDASPTLERRVSQIDVSNPHDAVVVIGADPTLLHVGDARFVERLTTYFELQPALQGRFQGIDYVDLRFDDRVYVHARGHAGVVTRTRGGAAKGT